MPRVARPEFARRASTHLSEEEVKRLERIARERGTTLATVLRWAARAYLEHEAQHSGNGHSAP